MLRSISGHWRAALKVALPWLALLTLLNVWSLSSQSQTLSPSGELNLGWIDLVALVIGLVATCSIAVSWHRFILIDAPLSSVSPFRMDRLVWAYLGRSILIYALCSIPLFAVILFKLNMFPVIFLPIVLAIFIQLAVFACRMSISLPAVAVERPAIGLKQALEITRGNNLKILGLMCLTYLVLALALIAYLTVVGLLSAVQPNLALVASLVLGIPVQFFSVMTNATLLTSLYGFFIEHRDF